jgi:hypothetical protein
MRGMPAELDDDERRALRKKARAMVLKALEALGGEAKRPELLEVHHRTYERLGRELTTDLTVPCNACHELYHERFGLPQREPAPAPRSRSFLRRLRAR